MSRRFGIGSSDAMLTGLASNGVLRSYAIWYLMLTEGGSQLGRFWDKRSGAAAQVDAAYPANGSAAPGPPNVLSYGRVFSGAIGEWHIQRPDPTTGKEWHHFAVTFDASNPLNNPVMYSDGVSQSVTRFIGPTGTANTNTSPYTVGNRSSDGLRNFDGFLAEFAIWDAILTDDEIAAIASGPSGTILGIQPASLVCYHPMRLGESPEPDLSGVSGPATLTGTAAPFFGPAPIERDRAVDLSAYAKRRPPRPIAA